MTPHYISKEKYIVKIMVQRHPSGYTKQFKLFKPVLWYYGMINNYGMFFYPFKGIE